MTAGWTVEHLVGDPAAHHAREVPLPARRTVWLLDTDRPALVLGSTQHADVADRAALDRRDVTLVHRRSGGGAVLLLPDEAAWIDVVVPRDDPLWHDDVGRSFGWVGETWCRALGALGVDGLDVHEGTFCRTEWSRLVCFAGLATGEVHLDTRKVVGISQRRTRDFARFQGVALRSWTPDLLLELLALPDDRRAAASAALADVALGVDRAPRDISAAFVSALP